jgi:hypothetical protein
MEHIAEAASSTMMCVIQDISGKFVLPHFGIHSNWTLSFPGRISFWYLNDLSFICFK